ncbi:MAG: GGDEF domain-containing response regulator [Nitrospirae bacterium]|nr:GGDEF domain-containing response regulator [Nitrospirota bacterium]
MAVRAGLEQEKMSTQTVSKPIEILLVEDNPRDARLFRENMAEVGAGLYGLTHAGQLNETIRYLDEGQYDVVMLDLTLPDSKGFDTFNRIRLHAPQVPIILLTGIRDEELAVRALQHGAQDYLIKGQVDGSMISRSIRFAIERHQSRERENRLSYFDALTNLPNRRLFYDRLNQALSHAQRYEEKVALMFIDLDGFKLVNDDLGHDLGDMLLQAVAERLEYCLRKSDTVARIGGDEFTCVLPHIEKKVDVNIVAQKIIKALNRPFNLKGQEICISGSIGASLFPDDTEDFEDLIKNADMAMYHAKKEGKNNFQFFADNCSYQR